MTKIFTSAQGDEYVEIPVEELKVGDSIFHTVTNSWLKIKEIRSSSLLLEDNWVVPFSLDDTIVLVLV